LFSAVLINQINHLRTSYTIFGKKAKNFVNVGLHPISYAVVSGYRNKHTQRRTTMTIQQIKTALIAAGWNYILSTTGNQSTGEYGLLFTKDGIKFWLNNKSRPIVSEIIAG